MSVLETPAVTLPYSLWSSEQIRRAEHELNKRPGEGETNLMVRAGWALFNTLRHTWPEARRLWVYCGGGNNGGDGYVLARLALEAGFGVRLFALSTPKAGTEAAQAHAGWLAAGGYCETTLPPLPLADAEAPDLLVDALLGIGANGELQGEVIDWIHYINQLPQPVLCADLPSGLHADTGRLLGHEAVKASLTLTFIGLKSGLLTGMAPEQTGIIALASLWPEEEEAPEDGVATLLPEETPMAYRVDYPMLSHWMKPRSRAAHKGDAGRVLLYGGAHGMPGAIRLAAEGALRAGAGLVKIATMASNHLLISSGRPELMLAEPLLTAAEDKALSDWAKVRVLGPGLGQSSWALALWQQQIRLNSPLVLDADGLNLLAEQPMRRDNWILTPHPGEAARLLDCTIADVEADRYAAVRALQRKYGGVVLLKGVGTLIADAQNCWVCQEGNPGMASGGMGDLLSGILAALWAQDLGQTQSALLAACIHGEAADRAAKEGERGMLASDLLPWVRRLVNPAG